MDPQGALELFMPIFQAQYWNRICYASSTIIVIYDYFITFGDEYDFIWNSRWSLGKVLFLLSRYYTLLSTILQTWVTYSPSVTTQVLVFYRVPLELSDILLDHCALLKSTAVSLYHCPTIHWPDEFPSGYWSTVLLAFGNLFQVVITDLILLGRLHAMYEGSRSVLYGAGIPFLLVILTAAAELVLYALGAHVTAQSVPGESARFCVQRKVGAQFGGNVTWIFWAQLLALEILLFGFALFKAYQTYRQMDDVTGSFVPKTLHVLIRDSTLYFLLIAVSYMACTIISPINNGLYQHLPEGFASAITSVMSQRLILNLRSCYYDKTAHGDSDNFTLSTWIASPQPLVFEHSVDNETDPTRTTEHAQADV